MKAIINGTIYTMANGVITGGTVLIDHGKIVAVGQDVSIPDSAEIIDAAGQMVFPGLIDANTRVGIVEEGVGEIGNDADEKTKPVTPEMRALDATWWRDVAFTDARSAGITSISIGPGSANVISGQAMVVKTAGNLIDSMVLKEPAGLKISLGGNRQAHRDRTDDIALFKAELQKAKEAIAKEAKRKEGEIAEPNLKLDPIVALLKGGQPAHISAIQHHDILNAIELSDEWGFELVLERVLEGHLVVEEIKASGAAVIAGPTMINKMGVAKNMSTKMPGVLAKAGVKVALCTDHPTIPVAYLAVQAALAVRDGMPEDDALRAITIVAAEVLGVADRVGSIEVGKDADLAIFSGHPFDVTTKTTMTLIDGEIAYQAPKGGCCTC